MRSDSPRRADCYYLVQQTLLTVRNAASDGVPCGRAALYADLTAWQNLKVQCRQCLRLNEADIAPTLQLVGLSDTGSKPAGKFSLRMRQRLGLAVALLGKPEFLVLDEPLNGLDPMGIQNDIFWKN